MSWSCPLSESYEPFVPPAGLDAGFPGGPIRLLRQNFLSKTYPLSSSQNSIPVFPLFSLTQELIMMPLANKRQKTKFTPLQLHQVPVQPARLKNSFTFP